MAMLFSAGPVFAFDGGNKPDVDAVTPTTQPPTDQPTISTSPPTRKRQRRTDQPTNEPTSKPTRFPTFSSVTDPDISVATYSEYSRETRSRCSASAMKSNQCWTDGEGNSFRYGCRVGDKRVFTDACGSGGCDAGCENDWKWAGEQQDTCYDDGQWLYQFMCSDAFAFKPEPERQEPAEPTQASCEKLGWARSLGDPNVCGESNINGKCAVGTWQQAEAVCASVNARLCTAAELANDETKGTGCKADCASVWSGDECTLGGRTGHVYAAGSNKCKDVLPATCSLDNAQQKVRCCSDVLDATGEKVVRKASNLPPGLSTAVSTEYKISDGSCGLSQPLRQLPCWTNPRDGSSMRFACSDDDAFVYHQVCENGCNSVDSCTGEWRRTGELTDQCYARRSEGYLYEYVCPEKKR